MLPNWLLGKSKSKLQEILGGGTDYTAGDGIDISNGVISFDPLTTPAIDPSKVDGLDDDLAALAPKTALSNPNILHNPWFTVNQRAFTTTTSNSQYPADRWAVYGDNPAYTMTRNSDGTITLDNTSGTDNVMFRQKRTTTYLNSLNGMKLTASVMFSDGTIITGTKIASSTAYTKYIDNEQMEVATWPAMGAVLSLLIKPGASVTVKALKLEVGEISTLHLDPRPEYAVELAKCQRYFIRFKNVDSYNKHISLGYAHTAAQLYFDLTLPSQMRTTPTLSASSIRVEKAGGSSTTGTPSISLFSNINNLTRLSVTGLSSLTTGALYSLLLPSGATLDFNAEL